MIRYSRALLAGGALTLALGIVLFELETAPAANFRPVFPNRNQTVPPPLNNVQPSLPLTPATPNGVYGTSGGVINNTFNNSGGNNLNNNGNNGGNFGVNGGGGGGFGGGNGGFGGGFGGFGGGNIGGFGGQGGFGGKNFGFNGGSGQ